MITPPKKLTHFIVAVPDSNTCIVTDHLRRELIFGPASKDECMRFVADPTFTAPVVKERTAYVSNRFSADAILNTMRAVRAGTLSVEHGAASLNMKVPYFRTILSGFNRPKLLQQLLEEEKKVTT